MFRKGHLNHRKLAMNAKPSFTCISNDFLENGREPFYNLLYDTVQRGSQAKVQ